MQQYFEICSLVNGFKPMQHAHAMDNEIWRTFQTPGSLLMQWKPVDIRFLTNEEHDSDDAAENWRLDSDCPVLIDAIAVVLSERARSALGDLLNPNGEFLPLDGPEDRRYYFYHCMHHVDLTDRMHSDGQHSRRTGELTTLRSPVLKPHRIDPGHAFDLNFYGFKGRVIVSDKVRMCAEEAGLVGIRFVPVPVCQICSVE